MSIIDCHRQNCGRMAELRGKGFVARLLQSTGTSHAAQQTAPVGPLGQPSRRSLAGRRCLAA